MGANQSGEAAGTAGNVPASRIPRNQPKPGAKTRLTYQESFDIRSRAADAFVPKIYRRNERKSSFSSSSGSGSPMSSRHVSRSASRALKRNKSNIKPPIFLFSGGRTRGWDNYTNGGNNNDWGSGGSHWATRKTSSAAESDISGKNFNSRPRGNVKMGQQQEQAQVSFDTDSDIEQEIDMILNDTSNGNEPWYHNHDNAGSACGSTSTVAMEIKGKEDGDDYTQDTLEEEDLNSTRSLPTPSHYLYLTFDDGDEDLGDDADRKPYNLDNKKSKSIEFLDGPSYFFLNYDADDDKNNSPADHEDGAIIYTENTNDTTEPLSDLPFDDVPSSNSVASISK